MGCFGTTEDLTPLIESGITSNNELLEYLRLSPGVLVCKETLWRLFEEGQLVGVAVTYRLNGAEGHLAVTYPDAWDKKDAH